MDKDENKPSVDEALSDYYNLKQMYEKTHYDKYVKGIVMSNISKLAKRQKFQELNKPLCINCKQPVGTIFDRKYYDNYKDKPEVIVFTAKCGNILNPCDLNIEIHKSVRESYDKLIKENTKIMNDFQMEIIKLKNKILFLGKKNIDESKYVDDFNRYKEQILYYSNVIGEYFEENILINDNPEEKIKLEALISSLNQQEIMQFKDYIRNYLETDDDNQLTSAINMYINEIMPKIKEIRSLKYKTMYMDVDENKIHTLIQSKYSPEGMNFYDEDVNEVVSFIKGTKVESTKKSKLEIKENEDGEEKEMEKSKKSKKSKTLKTVVKKSKSKTQKKQLKISDENINEEEDIVFDNPVTKKITKKEDSDEELSFETKSQPYRTLPEDDDEDKDKEKEEEKENKVEEEEEEEEEIVFTESIKPAILKQPKKIGKMILNEATEAL